MMSSGTVLTLIKFMNGRLISSLATLCFLVLLASVVEFCPQFLKATHSIRMKNSTYVHPHCDVLDNILVPYDAVGNEVQPSSKASLSFARSTWWLVTGSPWLVWWPRTTPERSEHPKMDSTVVLCRFLSVHMRVPCIPPQYRQRNSALCYLLSCQLCF